MLKSVVWWIITLVQTTVCFRYPSSCPDFCFCTHEFTDCKQNGLTELPPDLDLNATSLDISYNDFQEFPRGLRLFDKLIYLNLSHNQISMLDDDSSLRYLTNLERLDLTYNNFLDWKDIKASVFSSLTKLTFLDLSHNPLRSIPDSINPLRISSLQILRLNNCSMRNIYTNLLRHLPSLKELHVSENPITFLNVTFESQSLKFLDLSRCNLKYINPAAFVNLTSLETLWIYQNINLKKFSCDSYSLLYLDLSNCNLETVPNGYLPRVFYADFHGNHFRIIPKYSFINFTNLKYLDLSYNAISLIEDNAFRNLDLIESIDLSLNTLSSLSRNLFYSNVYLKILNLSRNYFNRVERFAINSLEILDLSSCEIQSVVRESLIDMPNLKVLNLSRNIISVLPDYFQGINLITLDVSLCRIKNINNRTFESMLSLRKVDLTGNRLTTTYPECFTQVVYLEISDNPWRCDCPSLKSMYFWLVNTGKGADGLICQSPEMYEGLSWLAACQSEWHPELNRKEPVWWYTTGLIVTVFVILFIILAMRRMYLLKEKRMREADEARRAEEREALRRMRRAQLESREEIDRTAPDPRELQRPPSYNEALLLPRLDASHPSLSGSLHSLGSKHSLHGSNSDVAKKGRPRRKRRRRKSDSSEGQRASRATTADSDTTDHEQPQPRTTLESDF